MEACSKFFRILGVITYIWVKNKTTLITTTVRTLTYEAWESKMHSMVYWAVATLRITQPQCSWFQKCWKVNLTTFVQWFKNQNDKSCVGY